MIFKRTNKLLFISIFIFLIAQLIKPVVIITIYKMITDFNPTLYSNYDLYIIVLKQMLAGNMTIQYTVSFTLAELLFLLAPWYPYYKSKN